MKQKADDLLAGIPPEWPNDPIPEIREIIGKSAHSLVVLDDDPTGTQTVYDIPVLTEWSVNTIKKEFSLQTPLFYILTNSRRLPEKEAVLLAETIGANLRQVSAATGRRFRVISRSDSTLRGHFPAEVDALAASLGQPQAMRIIMPFFLEGGRLTINDIHYVKDGDWLVPAGETSFARDATFGYRSSDLKFWVEEKTKAATKAAEVSSISLDEIRKGGPEKVLEMLLLIKSPVCVINAVSRRDAEVVALALLKAEERGLPFICRTAASIVPPLAGLFPRALLQPRQLDIPASGGALIIVGSYQPKSSAQLAHLIKHAGPVPFEVDVNAVLDGSLNPGFLAKEIDQCLAEEKDVVLYTSREPVEGEDADSSLDIVGKVSACLADIVKGITRKPRYITAKGGITSSDIATESLGVKRATVLGQILPGVPVWRLDEESKFGSLAYIVFPGNVGEEGSMSELVGVLE